MGIVGETLSGVITSVIASGIAWYLGRCYEKNRWRSKYSRYKGEYDGFVFSNTNGRQLKPTPISGARLSYNHDNILSIEVTHDEGKRRWQGDIFMETANSGSVVFRYVDRADELEFGFKRCIFEGDNEFYLVGEQTDGYGKEVFKRKKA